MSEKPNGIFVVVAVLIAIVVGIFVFWSVYDGVDTFEADRIEVFDGYTLATSNDSAWGVTLDNSPNSDSDCNVTAYNSTAKTESYPSFTLSGRQVSVAADTPSEFSQVNVTYTSKASVSSEDSTDMTVTVFSLMPIAVLVIVAGLILSVVMGLGDSGGGKNF